MNRHAIGNLRRDMDAWLKANIMCYDIRHTDTTIESRERLRKGEITFSNAEKVVINQLLVPYPIPGHAYFPIPDSKLNHAKGETLTLYQLQDHLRRVIATEARADAKWDEKMSGVYDIGTEARTPEVASSWRVASGEMKSLSEWISIIKRE